MGESDNFNKALKISFTHIRRNETHKNYSTTACSIYQKKASEHEESNLYLTGLQIISPVCLLPRCKETPCN